MVSLNNPIVFSILFIFSLCFSLEVFEFEKMMFFSFFLYVFFRVLLKEFFWVAFICGERNRCAFWCGKE